MPLLLFVDQAHSNTKFGALYQQYENLGNQKLDPGVLVVISVLAFLYLAYSYLAELILVFAGFVISISISPIVEWLEKHKLPRSLSVILIYSCLILFVLGIVFFVMSPLISAERGIDSVILTLTAAQSVFGGFSLSVQISLDANN